MEWNKLTAEPHLWSSWAGVLWIWRYHVRRSWCAIDHYLYYWIVHLNLTVSYLKFWTDKSPLLKSMDRKKIRNLTFFLKQIVARCNIFDHHALFNKSNIYVFSGGQSIQLLYLRKYYILIQMYLNANKSKSPHCTVKRFLLCLMCWDYCNSVYGA